MSEQVQILNKGTRMLMVSPTGLRFLFDVAEPTPVTTVALLMSKRVVDVLAERYPQFMTQHAKEKMVSGISLYVAEQYIRQQQEGTKEDE